MFVFNDTYKVDRLDRYNIQVKKLVDVEILDGKRKGTGTFKKEWVHYGYFACLTNALNKIKNDVMLDGVGETDNLENFIKYCEQFKVGENVENENI